MINRLARLVMLIGSLSGCAAVNHPSNTNTIEEVKPGGGYAFSSSNHEDSQVTVILAFSGGGTRAAALSYGVLKQLNDTHIVIDGQPRSLLSEVDVISSVSGGSFTAAYYGLYQDKIFTDYEQSFLKRNVKDDLISQLLSPSRWFSALGRTDLANNYYQDEIFGEKTFADIDTTTAPYIIINASDITTGVRFSFIQEYFNVLCSDVSQFPISKAVTASSAVPVLFQPVVLENHQGCETNGTASIDAVSFNELSFRSKKAVENIQQYDDKEKNRYIHLVDGGITDNLGLLAIYDLLEIGDFHRKLDYSGQSQHHIVVISVDASTEPELGIGQSVDFPTVAQTLNSITDIQLHRYNDATKALFMDSMEQWSSEASNDHVEVIPHFIQIGFNHTQDPESRHRFNQVPTDLTIDGDTVEAIIDEGQSQLKANTIYQSVVEQLAQTP
ncbi:patatin-like phospholipase family protein [Vibrio hippocampi]|uniref:PNPLA domain-containing protein n=1 Tax=Vibrio hippocampi TaxID=654686 RepID=A0ABN8DMW9_9VIBR|nr:patatin-like phospholipase family protein [Vibrio hippocampi]CAH0529786.1 hypothetical protein VHP8226_03542 [Vibrio hippocampi]